MYDSDILQKLLNWLDEAIYNNQAYVIIPVQYQIDGRTEMSIEVSTMLILYITNHLR